MNEAKHIQLNKAKWDRWAKSADSKGRRNDYLRKAQAGVISILNLKENMNFLDIGCGTGWALGQAAKSVDEKGSFYGIDLSLKMIEKAKENFKDKANFHFIVCNAESIPLENNLFDIIICTNSFHHYLHPDKALKEMHRLLKTGGRIYLLDPTADSWIIKLIDKVIKLIEPYHVKLYSTNEFKKLFVYAGLKYIACEKINTHQKVQVGEK